MHGTLLLLFTLALAGACSRRPSGYGQPEPDTTLSPGPDGGPTRDDPPAGVPDESEHRAIGSFGLRDAPDGSGKLKRARCRYNVMCDRDADLAGRLERKMRH